MFSQTFEEIQAIMDGSRQLLVVPRTGRDNRDLERFLFCKALFYQKKRQKPDLTGAGLVVGEAQITDVFHWPAGKRVGPPRTLLLYWASVYGNSALFLDNLKFIGDYDIPMYRSGSVLDWLWSREILTYVMEKNIWPDLSIRTFLTGLDEMEIEQEEARVRKYLNDCEAWLTRQGLINQYGEYVDCNDAFLIEDPVRYSDTHTLADYGLARPPKRTAILNQA